MYRAHLNALKSGSVLIFSHAPMPCFCTAARNAVSSSACQYPRNVPVGESEVVAFFPPFITTATGGGDGDGGVEAAPALFSPFFSVVIFVVVAAALFALCCCFANLSFIFLFFQQKYALSLSLSSGTSRVCVRAMILIVLNCSF